MDEQAYQEAELNEEQAGEPLAEARKDDDDGFIGNTIGL
jgi:hypothetical protein